LARLILLGEKFLRAAIQNFVVNYYSKQNNQGLENRLILCDLRRAV
jgi:hypothetical protein